MQNVSVTFTGQSVADVRSEMAAMLGVAVAPAFKPEVGPIGEADPGKPARVSRKKADTVQPEVQQGIQTGGDRELEKAPEASPVEYTVDDVRKAAKPYIDKFTMAAAQVDLQFCLKDAVGLTKMSEFEGKDQETLKKGIDALNAAAAAESRYVPKAA
jgi:hypothetical protein